MVKSVNSNSQKVSVTTGGLRRQKVLAFVVFIGLFLCGLFVGWGLNSKDVSAGTQMETFSENVAAEPADEPRNLSTCERIEHLLLAELNDADNHNYVAHLGNATTYNKLAQYGCDENRADFAQKAIMEQDVARALGANEAEIDYSYGDVRITTGDDARPCATIEKELSMGIRSRELGDNMNYEKYLNNADIYSTMADKGCPENATKYKELALGQLEIASALAKGGEMMKDRDDVETVIDVYKKLQMQQEAYRFLNKIQRLVNPATDFILQMEKIIDD